MLEILLYSLILLCHLCSNNLAICRPRYPSGHNLAGLGPTSSVPKGQWSEGRWSEGQRMVRNSIPPGTALKMNWKIDNLFGFRNFGKYFSQNLATNAAKLHIVFHFLKAFAKFRQKSSSQWHIKIDTTCWLKAIHFWNNTLFWIHFYLNFVLSGANVFVNLIDLFKAF